MKAYRENVVAPKDEIGPQLCVNCAHYRIYLPARKAYYKCLSPAKNSNYKYLGVTIGVEEAAFCDNVRGESVLCDGFSPKPPPEPKPEPVLEPKPPADVEMKRPKVGGSKTGLYIGGALVFLSLVLGGIVLATMGPSNPQPDHKGANHE